MLFTAPPWGCDVKIEHTLTVRNAAGAVVFQADVLVSLYDSADGWYIIGITDESDNTYDSHLGAACIEYLWEDAAFREKADNAIRAQRSGQRSNQRYDAKYGD